MQYRSPISKARGLGSAKSGTGHWWLQRVTAVALIPTTFWLILLLDTCVNAPYEETVAWLNVPLNGACVITWILVAFYHAALGVQVVIEDYVSDEGLKIVSVWIVNLVFLLLAIASLIAVFKIISAG
ncbi:MAG: succinate dehydrogenase, hydrophobic membrane anchor protein [Gammaproteobacteria bacterium]